MPASIGRPFCVWWWSCATRRRRATTPWLSILDFLLLAVFEIQSSSINQSMASSSTSIGSWLACYSQHSTTKCYKTSLIKCLSPRQLFYPPQLNNAKGKVIHPQYGTFEAARKLLKRQIQLFASTEDGLSDIEFMSDTSEQQMQRLDTEELTPESDGPIHFERSVGKSGFISFYGRSHEKKEEYLELPLSKHQSILIWFLGPSVLVASFIFPSLYLRRILSSIFEDSLLTDFLILFFTEALFYCGVAVFVLLIDRLQSPLELISTPKSSVLETTHQWLHRISSVATLVLSLIIPMVTMGLVWPWTGPAASATLAPYLVGIVMQFAFEQYAKYVKSPSWPVIPIVFQVYRLHQLNRAAQLVTALSFTVRGAEATLHNVAINRSLGTLLNVLQFLGVICIWSLSSFLMRFFPSATRPES